VLQVPIRKDLTRLLFDHRLAAVKHHGTAVTPPPADTRKHGRESSLNLFDECHGDADAITIDSRMLHPSYPGLNSSEVLVVHASSSFIFPLGQTAFDNVLSTKLMAG
jgi:hypothetical protein